MIEESRMAATHPQDVAQQQKLTQVARDVSQALSKCVGCLPGQKDVDEAIQSINKSSQVFIHLITIEMRFIKYLYWTITDFGKRTVPSQ